MNQDRVTGDIFTAEDLNIGTPNEELAVTGQPLPPVESEGSLCFSSPAHGNRGHCACAFAGCAGLLQPS
jgi:hypothetical protein